MPDLTINKDYKYDPANDRRDPSHPVWNDAKFDMLDASYSILYDPKTKNALIYIWGEDIKKNIFLSARYVDKITAFRLGMDQ